MFVNKDAWYELDEQTRNVIKGLAMLAERAGTAEARQLSDWYVSQLVSHGMIVQSVNEQLRNYFEQIGATMIQEWLSEVMTSVSKVNGEPESAICGPCEG